MDGFTVRLVAPQKWLHWELPIEPGDVGIVTGAHWTHSPDGRLLLVRFGHIEHGVWVLARDVEVISGELDK